MTLPSDGGDDRRAATRQPAEPRVPDVPGGNPQHPFAALTPDTILDALDAAGFRTDARLLPLNSYENRVYQAGIDDAGFVVAKFYRPGRWRDAQILEEHAFTHELAAHELPVVAPLSRDGTTLFLHAGFRFAVYPRQGGRAPAIDDLDNLQTLGRFLGRLHAVGAVAPFRERIDLGVDVLGTQSRDTVLASPYLPDDLHDAYANLTGELLEHIAATFAALPYARIRLHGDCHLGNVLWRDDAPHFVDFDDAMNGPAVQDLWMLLSGSTDAMQRQLAELVDGYETFHPFAAAELALVEPLRTLRILHHAAWITRRFDDPAFPPAFPWFGSHGYWRDHLGALAGQRDALAAPPLLLFRQGA
jgi:Ser/Thr protein kinase RdoA (MazF antagonist)